jgi:hypothetical protein
MPDAQTITSNAESQLEQLYQQNAQLEAHAAPFLNITNTGFGENASIDQQWSKDLVQFLGVSVLLFGLFAMLLMFVLFLRNRSNELVLRAFGIPLIIVSAVFLIVAGYTEKQIAPVMGLLGTIAGYLLAKTETPSGTAPPRT